MGLDESSLGALKSSLLSRDPLPTLNQAFSIVQRDETVKLGTKETEIRPEIVGFSVQSSSRGRVDYKEKICNICGKKGHGEERCYAHIGYPVWWKGTRVDTAGVSKSDRGVSPTLPLARPKASAHVIGLQPSDKENSAETSSLSVIPGGFTDEQWRILMSTFHKGKKTASETLSGPFQDADWSR
ncbi:PREDICTED: uncharacterized protein LOC104779058 [Camelina sativa]|uniref:Uncharacterized protein LOC104779058 n=1 Tax=Camelina sativa TaxID=90675 RepID=A0ABM1RK22_CAMSA|nr:PREDICTED: uncharacterized protein LOC104779058 [Camelina sativa]